MRLTPIRRVPAGAVLARDVETGHAGGIPLLRSGVELSERYKDHLEKAGIHAVWVDDGLSAGIAPVEALSQETRKKASQGFQKAISEVGRSLEANRTVPPAAIDEMAKIVDLIAKDVMNAPEMALALEDLASGDAYTHRHSINVCAVGLLVGRRLFRNYGWLDGSGRRRTDRYDHRLRMLGMGLLLHDIGKLTVPSEILNKPTKLDANEWELMKTHPQAGIELLPQVTSPLIKSVVRDHHERWNGSGYPRGLVGEEIGQLPCVAAVSDVYDAITSERIYAGARPPYVAIDVIREGRGRSFDPDVVDVFRQVVFPYPPGTEVTLPDGRTAVVAEVDPKRPDEPTVRIAAEGGGWDQFEVDLSPDARKDKELPTDPRGIPPTAPADVEGPPGRLAELLSDELPARNGNGNGNGSHREDAALDWRSQAR